MFQQLYLCFATRLACATQHMLDHFHVLPCRTCEICATSRTGALPANLKAALDRLAALRQLCCSTRQICARPQELGHGLIGTLEQFLWSGREACIFVRCTISGRTRVGRRLALPCHVAGRACSACGLLSDWELVPTVVFVFCD